MGISISFPTAYLNTCCLAPLLTSGLTANSFTCLVSMNEFVYRMMGHSNCKQQTTVHTTDDGHTNHINDTQLVSYYSGSSCGTGSLMYASSFVSPQYCTTSICTSSSSGSFSYQVTKPYS